MESAPRRTNQGGDIIMFAKNPRFPQVSLHEDFQPTILVNLVEGQK